MGFSGTNCAKNLIDWKSDRTNLYFACQGTTHIGNVVGGIGMNHDNIITTCYIDESIPVLDSSGFNDMANFDMQAFTDSIMNQCKGNQTCNAFVMNEITGIAPEHQETYMYLFAQVACVQDDETLNEKHHWGLVVACLGVAICMIWQNSMEYLMNMDEINDKLYDMQLVTVSDYAVMA